MLKRIPILRGLNLRESDINRPPEFAQDCRNVEKNSKGEVILRWGYDKINSDPDIIDLFEYIGSENDPQRGSLLALKRDGLYRLVGSSFVKINQGNTITSQPEWTTQTKPVEYNKVFYWNDPSLNVDLWKFDGYSQYRAGVPQPIFSSLPSLSGDTYYFRVLLAHYDTQGNVTYGDYKTFKSADNNITLNMRGISVEGVGDNYGGFYQKFAEFSTADEQEIYYASAGDNNLTADLGTGEHNYVQGDTALLLNRDTSSFDPIRIASTTTNTITFEQSDVEGKRFTVNSVVYGGIERRWEILVYRSQSEFSNFQRLKETTTVQNEKQTVTFSTSPTSGDFTLRFEGQTTSSLAYNAPAATVEAALDALSTINDCIVTKLGNEYTVEFAGTQAGTDVSELEIASNTLAVEVTLAPVAWEFNSSGAYPFINQTGFTGLEATGIYDIQNQTISNIQSGGALNWNGTSSGSGYGHEYVVRPANSISPGTPIRIQGGGPSAGPAINTTVTIYTYRANGTAINSYVVSNTTGTVWSYDQSISEAETVTMVRTSILNNYGAGSASYAVDYVRTSIQQSVNISIDTITEGGSSNKKDFSLSNTNGDFTLTYGGSLYSEENFSFNLEQVYDSTLVRVLPPKAKYITLYNEFLILGNIDPKSEDFGYASRFGENTRLEDAIVWSDISTFSNGSSIETFLINNIRPVGNSEDGAISAIHGNDDNLVVHKQKQSYYLNGDLINNNVRSRKAMTEQIGSASHRSIRNVEGGHLYVSPKGVHLSVGGQRPTELSDLIEPVFTEEAIFSDLDFVNAKSITDFLREKIYIFIPRLSNGGIVLSYDYYHKDWFVHDNIPAVKGFQDVGVTSTDIYFADSTGLYKRNLESKKDVNSRIIGYYWTGWFDLDMPSVVKKFVNFILLSIAKKDFTATIKGYCNWNADTEESSNTIEFNDSVHSEDTQVLEVQANCVSYRISNESDGSDLHITSYEVEFEPTQTKPKGTI